MKKLLCTIAALMITASAFGQGSVIFENRLPEIYGGLQPIYLGGTSQLRGDQLNGSALPGPGAGYNVALYRQDGANWVQVALKQFRTTTAGAFYVAAPGPVIVDGVPAGAGATFRLRAWDADAPSWDAAVAGSAANQWAYGESNDVLVGALGGNVPGQPAIPDPYLEGLQEFNLFIVPEPSTIALGVLGAAALLLRRRK